MKAATSLNAYAESYVPLSKRGAFNSQKAFKPPDEFAAVGPHLWYPAVKAPQIHNIHNIDAYYASMNSGLTGHAVNGYGRLSSFHSSDVKDKSTVDEQQQQHYNTGDSSEKLPDTLDIGDVAEEQGVSSEFPFKKMKDIHIEAGASSSYGVSG